MDYKKYFLDDNKSGYKTNQKWLSKNNPDLYHKITTRYGKYNISFKEMVYLFIYNLNEVPVCKTCGSKVKFKGTLKKGYSQFCSIKCTNRNEDRKSKIKDKLIEQYGMESHNQLDFVKEKKKKTTLENYGVENPAQIKRDFSLTKSYKDFISTIESNSDYKVIEYIGDSIYKIYHSKCDSTFEISSRLIKNRKNIDCEICTTCTPYKSFSGNENIIKNILDKNKIQYESMNRSILDGKEIDFYLPDYNIGIEINGLYWHSEKYKDKNYHLDKLNLANSKNINLIQFFEDELNDKSHIIESMILSKCRLSRNKIYARKCIIKEVSSKESNQFLSKNHLQGKVNSLIRLGLYYDNELVSLMTFGKKRIALGSYSNDSEYELYRFCNKLNHNIIGGASRLLKYFENTYKPSSIISYANKRYSNGKLYEKIGFNLIGESEPNYYYTYGNKRYYRYRFRKNILIEQGYDKNLTEHQIMNNRGYLKIYDCGNYKYMITYTY